MKYFNFFIFISFLMLNYPKIISIDAHTSVLATIQDLNLGLNPHIVRIIFDYYDDSIDKYNKLNKQLNDFQASDTILPETRALFDHVLKLFGINESLTLNVIHLYIKSRICFNIHDSSLAGGYQHKLHFSSEQREKYTQSLIELLDHDHNSNLSDQELFTSLNLLFNENRYHYLFLSLNVAPRLFRLWFIINLKNNTELLEKITNSLLLLLYNLKQMHKDPPLIADDIIFSKPEELSCLDESIKKFNALNLNQKITELKDHYSSPIIYEIFLTELLKRI